MTEPESLVLEILRKIQGTLADHDRQFRELKAGQGRIERDVNSLQREFVGLRGDLIEYRHALAGLEMRFERIENRLELRDS